MTNLVGLVVGLLFVPQVAWAQVSGEESRVRAEQKAMESLSVAGLPEVSGVALELNGVGVRVSSQIWSHLTTEERQALVNRIRRTASADGVTRRVRLRVEVDGRVVANEGSSFLVQQDPTVTQTPANAQTSRPATGSRNTWVDAPEVATQPKIIGFGDRIGIFVGAIFICSIPAALLALVPAGVAWRRGRRFRRWWMYGFLFFVGTPALLSASILTDDIANTPKSGFSPGGSAQSSPSSSAGSVDQSSAVVSEQERVFNECVGRTWGDLRGCYRKYEEREERINELAEAMRRSRRP